MNTTDAHPEAVTMFEHALEIATRHAGGSLVSPTVHDGLPPRLPLLRRTAGRLGGALCARRQGGLQSARLIAFSKETGRVAYDGEAEDEF